MMVMNSQAFGQWQRCAAILVVLVVVGLVQVGSASATTGPTAMLDTLNMFMGTTKVEVGARPNGSFAADIATPAGFHPRDNHTPPKLGFRSNPGECSWEDPACLTDGDFFAPGGPYEAWAVQVGSATAAQNNPSATGVAGGFTSVDAAAPSAVWQSSAPVSGLSIKQTYSLPSWGWLISIKVEITNTTGATINDVYFMRGVDPDNCQTEPRLGLCDESGALGKVNQTYDTHNTIVSSGTAGTGAVVTATQTDDTYLALQNPSSNARAVLDPTWGFSTDIAALWTGSSPFEQTTGFTVLNDTNIYVVEKIASIAAGETKQLTFKYVLRENSPTSEPVPPVPTITSGPAASTILTAATFVFAGTGASAFECQLDAAAWSACVSPLVLSGLAAGSHTFRVRAVGGTEVASQTWVIGASAGALAGTPTNHVVASVSSSIRIVPVVSEGGSPGTVVGCAVTGELVLDRCVVQIYGPRSALAGTGGGVAVKASGSSQVLIGTGSYVAKDATTKSVQITVLLNAKGRRMLRSNLNGFGGLVRVAAFPKDAVKLTVSKKARMRPLSQLVLPTDGLFGLEEYSLTSAGRRFVARIAEFLPRRVASVTCTGYTDNWGTVVDNLTFGRWRAEAVCAALEAAGVRATVVSAQSQGEGQPRASNATAEGRALNRRVEIKLTY